MVKVTELSPTRMAQLLGAFLAGGPNTPDPPWPELTALYKQAATANEVLTRALCDCRNRAGLDLATATAKRARRDLLHALRPLQSLSRFGRNYLAAVNRLPAAAEARLAAIGRLKNSLSLHARRGTDAQELEGLVLDVIGEAERLQPIRIGLRWLDHKAPVVPARRLGLGATLEQWFLARSERLYREARDIPHGDSDDELIESRPGTLADPCELAIVREATSQLTRAEREVWDLTRLGLDDAAISARLGLTAAVVKSRRGEAHRRLTAFLQAPARRRPKA